MKSFATFFAKMSASKSVLLLLAPLLTAILSMKAALIGLAFLIIVDLITGIRRTFHEWGIKFNPFKKVFWKSIKSYLLRQTWKKTYEYGLGILVILVFEHLVFGVAAITIASKVFTLTEMAIVLPAVIEVWSIFENFEAVSGTNILKRLSIVMPPMLRRLFKYKEKEVKDIEIVDEIELEK